jgi:hypothetical protein
MFGLFTRKKHKSESEPGLLEYKGYTKATHADFKTPPSFMILHRDGKPKNESIESIINKKLKFISKQISGSHNNIRFEDETGTVHDLNYTNADSPTDGKFINIYTPQITDEASYIVVKTSTDGVDRTAHEEHGGGRKTQRNRKSSRRAYKHSRKTRSRNKKQ